MIVFDKTLLDTTFLVKEVNSLTDSGFIKPEKSKAIVKEMQTLKTHDNLLLRFVMFLLGCLLYSSICGFFSLTVLSSIDTYWKVMIFIFSLIGFVGQEFILAKASHFFGYGIDDAAILGALLTLSFGISEVSGSNYLAISIVLALTSTLTYLRYLHLPSALLACLSFTASLFFTLIDYCQYGQQIMPFAMLIFAGIVYYLTTKKLKNITDPYYKNGLLLLKIVGLLLFYFAGNYFVVRELSFTMEIESLRMNDPYPTASSEIPMAWLFYTFTLLTPLVYIVFSLLKKDKILLWIGMLTLGFTVFTIRNYHHVLPTEIALTASGIILFAIAYFSIRKLKNKESGITFMADRFESSNTLLQLETIASAAQFGMKPETQLPDSTMEFGGGGFSGGGAGSEF